MRCKKTECALFLWPVADANEERALFSADVTTDLAWRLRVKTNTKNSAEQRGGGGGCGGGLRHYQCVIRAGGGRGEESFFFSGDFNAWSYFRRESFGEERNFLAAYKRKRGAVWHAAAITEWTAMAEARK